MFLALSFTFLLADRFDLPHFEALRISAIDRVSPYFVSISEPLLELRRRATRLIAYGGALRELEALRAENRELHRLQLAARQMKQRLERVEALARFTPGQPTQTISGRVFADAGGPFSNAVLVNIGSSQGINKGHAVLDEFGFVGRTIAVGKNVSRVLLISDPQSRVPVTVGARRVPAILAGAGQNRLRLEFVEGDVALEPGEAIVTSGLGGLLPPGLAVGTVSASDGGAIGVAPYSRTNQPDYVRILVFTPPAEAGLENAEIEAAQPLPGATASLAPGRLSQ